MAFQADLALYEEGACQVVLELLVEDMEGQLPWIVPQLQMEVGTEQTNMAVVVDTVPIDTMQLPAMVPTPAPSTVLEATVDWVEPTAMIQPPPTTIGMLYLEEPRTDTRRKALCRHLMDALGVVTLLSQEHLVEAGMELMGRRGN
jgi:hypothetical protein